MGGGLYGGAHGGGGSGVGGGGNGNQSYGSGGGGARGEIVLKYPDTFTISQTGLTEITNSSGGYKITRFTVGTGNVTFS